MLFKKINLNETIDNKILTEAFSQPVEELTSGFTPDMKYELEMGAGGEGSIDWDNPSAFFRQGRNLSEDAWTNSFQSSSGHNTDNLIKLFIQCTLTPKPVSETELESWGDILISLIRQLGFKRNENAFLKFLDKKTFELKKDDVITLNNLWSDGIISSEDLKGIGPDGMKHIIFNERLYNSKNNLATDEWDIVSAYSDLTNLSVAKKIDIPYICNPSYIGTSIFRNNFVSGKEYNIKLDESGHYAGSNAREVRDRIIYDNNGDINKLYWIQRVLNDGTDAATTARAKGSTDDKSGSEKNAEYYGRDIKKNLTGNQILSVVKKLIADGTISIDDLKS